MYKVKTTITEIVRVTCLYHQMTFGGIGKWDAFPPGEGRRECISARRKYIWLCIVGSIVEARNAKEEDDHKWRKCKIEIERAKRKCWSVASLRKIFLETHLKL